MKRLLWRFSEPNKYYFIGELLGGKNYSPKMVRFVEQQQFRNFCGICITFLLGSSGLLYGRNSSVGHTIRHARGTFGDGKESIRDLSPLLHDADRFGTGDRLLQHAAGTEGGYEY